MAIKKSKKKNNKKIKFGTALFLLLIIMVALYAASKVIKLIIDPTNSVIVEEGTITLEESACRICD